jgi:hypothetical protein
MKRRDGHRPSLRRVNAPFARVHQRGMQQHHRALDLRHLRGCERHHQGGDAAERQEAVDSDDAQEVMAQMKETPVNDFFAKNGRIRDDGRMVQDIYLFQVTDSNA